MVIRPLDDSTYCVQFPFPNSGISSKQFVVSFHRQSMCSYATMRFVCILNLSPTVWRQCERDCSTPLPPGFGGLWGPSESGIVSFETAPMGSYQLTSNTQFLSLPWLRFRTHPTRLRWQWYYRSRSYRFVERESKVITTIVIGPLEDHTYCARSVFNHLWLWRKLYDCSLHHLKTSQCISKSVLLTFSSTFQPVGLNLTFRPSGLRG